MAKTNQKALELIQKEFIKQKNKSSLATPDIQPETLEKLGIDISKKKIEMGNLVLKKDLWPTNKYSINLLDKKKDLDGIPLNEHVKLLTRIQKLWDQGEKKIPYDDLQKLKIWTPITNIKIGNFELYSSILNGNNFTIALIDENKDGYGRWIDKAVDHKKIVKVLDAYKFTKNQLKTYKETTLNAELEKHFRKYFDNANKSKGNLKGIFDLEIGNMSYVIEIKLSSSAKKTGESDRAYGQMKRYLGEFKSKNYMLLIAGDASDKQDSNIKTLKKAAEKEFGVNFYFMDAE